MVQMIIPLLAELPAVALAWAATFLLHSTLLIGSIWVLTRLLGMKAMTVQDKLWKMALTGALFSCTVQAGLGDGSIAPRISLPPLSLPAIEANDNSAWPVLEPAVWPLHRQLPAAVVGRSVEGPNSRARVESGATSPVTVHESIPIRWQWFILLFWGLGAAGFTGSLVLQLLRLRARFRSRTEITSGPAHRIFRDLAASRHAGRQVRLTVSDRISVPVACGIRRPEVCLPSSMVRSLAPDQLKSVLAHELAHIVRRDQVWLLAARLAVGIFFFQPLVRLARRCYQETAEFICDGEAVRRTGKRIPLARSLYQMALRRVSTPTALTMPGISGKGSPLNRRIEMILDRNRTAAAGDRTRWFGPLAAALILVFAFLAPGVTAGDDPPRPEEVQPTEALPAPAAPDPDRIIVAPLVERVPLPEVPAVKRVAVLSAPRAVVQAAVDVSLTEPAAVPRASEPVEPLPAPRVVVSPEPVETERFPEPAVPDEEEVSEAEAAAVAEVEREMAEQAEAMRQAEVEMAVQAQAMQEAEREMAAEEEAMALLELEMAEQEAAMALADQEMEETEREMEAEASAMAEAEREMELMERELASHELDLAQAERELAEQEDALAREEEALHEQEDEDTESTDGEPRQLSRAQREEIRKRHRELQERHREITRQHVEISREHRDAARRQAEALRQRRAVFHTEETALRVQRHGLERALHQLDKSLAGELTGDQRERLGAMKKDIEEKLRNLAERRAVERTVVASESVPRPEELE